MHIWVRFLTELEKGREFQYSKPLLAGTDPEIVSERVRSRNNVFFKQFCAVFSFRLLALGVSSHHKLFQNKFLYTGG